MRTKRFIAAAAVASIALFGAACDQGSEGENSPGGGADVTDTGTTTEPATTETGT